MNAEPKPAASLLREAREAFHQEWAHLQIVGRALTPEELRRSETLGRVIPLLDEALAILEAKNVLATD